MQGRRFTVKETWYSLESLDVAVIDEYYIIFVVSFIGIDELGLPYTVMLEKINPDASSSKIASRVPLRKYRYVSDD